MHRLDGNTNGILTVFVVLAVLAFFAVENSIIDVQQRWYAEKLAAAKLAQAAAMHLKAHRIKNDAFIDVVNDPNQTALIGQEYSPITTDRGFIDAKLATTNPNVAAVVVEMLKEAGLHEGDHVAVAVTGSFPALNIAVFSAMEILNIKGIVITSVGASNWGANDPQFTWLDMERNLNEAGILHTHSVGASIGGGGDIGRGLSPEGREMIVQAIKRNGVDFINEDHLDQSIEKRLKIYDDLSKESPIKAYINVGGGIASLGTTVNGEIIPNGLSMNLAMKNYPVRGAIIEMGKRGIPIIHLYNIRQLWSSHGLPANPVPLPEPGSGGIFVQRRYNAHVALIGVLILISTIIVVAIIDRRRHRLGTERVPLLNAESAHDL